MVWNTLGLNGRIYIQDEVTIVETTLAMLRPLEQRYHKLHEAIKSIESGLFGNDVIEGNLEEKRIQYNSLQVNASSIRYLDFLFSPS